MARPHGLSSDALPARRLRLARLGRLLLVVAALAVSAGACGKPENGRDDLRTAGEGRRIRLGFTSGPLDELVVLRDTAGRLVVSGVCLFPDGTRLTVALYDSTGRLVGRTQPVIEDALFRSLPLGDDQGRGWPAGRYAVELSAAFAPGAQPPEALRAFGKGERFRGPGMTRSRQGHPAYERRFQVEL